MGARVRDSPTMASTEAHGDSARGTAQERSVEAGMILSPQRETSDRQADLSALGSGSKAEQPSGEFRLVGE